MSEFALQVDDIGKAYRVHESAGSRFLSWMGMATGPVDERWVLRHVSLSVAPGEAVGIVGQNGAGKSTLLKLITGTTTPSEGRVRSSGRVAAILELALGFQPELTGRENARHTLRLMGFDAAQASALVPAVEEFAEVGEYFDRPLRIYSSGMQVRVAFAVATAYRPDLLIVDEALSVGDSYFQHKSFERIRQFQREGTSLLLVSHDAGAILSLCSRAILLEQGRVLRDGAPSDVMDYYNALIADKENSVLREQPHESGRLQLRSGTGEAYVESIELVDADGNLVEHVNVGSDVELRIAVRAGADLPRLVLGYMIKDRLGQPVFGTNTHHTGQAIEHVRAGQRIEYRARFVTGLGPGSYSISTALVSSDTHLVNNYEWCDLALMFTVTNLDKTYFIGSAWLPPQIEVQRS